MYIFNILSVVYNHLLLKKIMQAYKRQLVKRKKYS